MAFCSFSELVGDSSCGTSSDYPDQLKCMLLTECDRDISRHLQVYGISEDRSLDSEMALILARAGNYHVFTNVFAI